MQRDDPVAAPATLTRRCDLVAPTLDQLVRDLAGVACSQEAEAADFPFDLFSKRVWNCLEYHWDRLPKEPLSDLQSEFARLAECHRNLLEDVVLAQALELACPQAAETFQVHWMPLVRATASRVGGPAAAE